MTGPLITAATYNIHGCVGTDGRYSPERIVAVLDEISADIVGLQEVDTRRPHWEGLHQFDYLCQATRLHAVAGPNVREARGEYGNALLSRWPIATVRRSDLSQRRKEPRGALDADLETPHGPLRVIVTHLGLWARERRRQVARLLETMLPIPETPTLLLGDFNDWGPLGGFQIRALARQFAAAYAPRSYPSVLPLVALDRIYVHPLPVVAKARAHASRLARRASDHLPIAVDLTWDR